MPETLKIMVTGARGMLGSDLCQVLDSDFQVYGFDIEDFDIVDEQATMHWALKIEPDVIFHLAAYTNVDGSEDNRETAFAVNAIGTQNISRAARNSNSRLIYLSTDYVFDGTKGEPYVETDEPNPINYYGLTKLYGELYVAQLTLHHLIVRTSWLFGPNGKNFVDTIIAKAEAGESLKVVNDQHGCPTYTLHLARALREAMESNLEGIIHLTNAGATTWYELAIYALNSAGVSADVKPVSSRAYPTKAKRPAYSVLSSSVAGSSSIRELPPWQDGVRDHLRRRKKLREE